MTYMFSGTGVALVTPFFEDGAIDYNSLERLINHVIDNGVDYLVALGTTSEAPTFTTKEKKDVFAYIYEKAAGRIPVVCGIGGNNTYEVIEQLKDEAFDKADGILTVVPYYNKPSQEGIYRHFAAIASATEKPIILYNVPTRTVANMAATTTIRLAKEFKNIVAIKEATPDIAQCMHLVQNRPEGFSILSGDDILTIAQLSFGFDGVISVAANSFPKDFTSLVNAGLSGDFHLAKQLHYKLLAGMELLFAEGNPTGVKAVLAEMGILQNNLRLPLMPASEKLLEAIRNYLFVLEQ